MNQLVGALICFTQYLFPPGLVTINSQIPEASEVQVSSAVVLFEEV